MAVGIGNVPEHLPDVLLGDGSELVVVLEFLEETFGEGLGDVLLIKLNEADVTLISDSTKCYIELAWLLEPTVELDSHPF